MERKTNSSPWRGLDLDLLQVPIHCPIVLGDASAGTAQPGQPKGASHNWIHYGREQEESTIYFLGFTTMGSFGFESIFAHEIEWSVLGSLKTYWTFHGFLVDPHSSSLTHFISGVGLF